MAYQLQSITIRKEDRTNADHVLLKHWTDGTIDTVNVSEQKNSDGIDTVTYWIKPYIYDDFVSIKNVLELSGIQIL